MLVRPHDLLIRRNRNSDGLSLAATVYRVLTAGSVVKVELVDEHGRLVQVHLSHERYRETPVTPCEKVYLEPHRPHVYNDDGKWNGNYVI